MTTEAEKGRARPFAARLAWLALAGQLAFVLAWLVAGALEPGYSHVEQGVSELSAAGSRNGWIVSGAFLVLGASIAALAPAVRMTLPGGRAAGAAAALFALTGLGIALTGLLPLDCPMSEEACRARWRAGQLSSQHEAHLWAGLATELLLVATPFALARALWPRPAGVAALQAGVVGVALGAAVWLGYEADADGLVQRLSLGVLHLWVGLVAAGVLFAARPPAAAAASSWAPPSAAASLAWSGDGEMVLRPFLLWRRFPQRFRYRREVTWLTDELWVVEDEASFEGGWVVRRLLYCTLVDRSTLHVTAGDMPDGGQATIEEDGYAVAPYRLALPLGPVQVVTTCRERARVERGETVRGTMELHWLGVPGATLTARARPLS